MAVVQIPDINGQPEQVCFQQPGTPTDRSGTCTGTALDLLDPVPTGQTRGGWIVQNCGVSATTMTINDIGSPADLGPSCVQLAPGQFWPPPGYPVTQGGVSILGMIGDNFMAREW